MDTTQATAAATATDPAPLDRGDPMTTEEQTYTTADLLRAYQDGIRDSLENARTDAMNRVADATDRAASISPTVPELIRQHALSWAATGRNRWWRSGRASRVLADAERYETWVRDAV